ncbi:MAG: NifU family protein [Bacteroidia bacterium]|nr:NifU family protein [Bacteroidia bacterium]MBL4715084.1 NifU family protein [Bacteroidia bacterium]
MENKIDNSLIEKIEEALNSIRPYLEADGGNVELLGVSEEMNVSLKLLGSCEQCPMSVMTLKAGVEQALIKAVPEIKSVECVNLTDPNDPNAVLPENLR